MMQTMIPDKGPVLQDDNAPIYTCGIAWNRFCEHIDELEHPMWLRQSPDPDHGTFAGYFGKEATHPFPSSKNTELRIFLQFEFHIIHIILSNPCMQLRNLAALKLM